MTYRVLLTEKAEGDVEAVLTWFHHQQATEAGGRWLASLLTKLDTLETHPERCSLAPESANLGEEIRELLFGRKRFKYRLLFSSGRQDGSDSSSLAQFERCSNSQ